MFISYLVTAAFAGKWLEDVGPRLVGVVAALCWGGGFATAAVGLTFHSLPLLYLGYGMYWGSYIYIYIYIYIYNLLYLY